MLQVIKSGIASNSLHGDALPDILKGLFRHSTLDVGSLL